MIDELLTLARAKSGARLEFASVELASELGESARLWATIELPVRSP